MNRRGLTLRGTLVAIVLGGLLYVGAIAMFLALRVQPTATALEEQSRALRDEYELLRARSTDLSAAVTRVRGFLQKPVQDIILTSERLHLQALFDSIGGVRSARELRGISSDLRGSLAHAATVEGVLASAMLRALAALELRRHAEAAQNLVEADSLNRELAEAISNATGLAIRDVNRRETGLAQSAAGAVRALGIWAAAGILLLPLLLLWLHRRFYQPLAKLDRGMSEVSGGNLLTSVQLGRDDELGRLGAHFNQMTNVLRVRAEEERHRLEGLGEERFRHIVSNALDAVVAIDKEGRVTDWNPQAEATFGWTREEVLGRALSELIIPPEFHAAHDAGLAGFRESGTGRMVNRRIEITALRKNGNQFPVELAISAITYGDGRVGFSAFLRDIEQRRKAESALRESEERFRATFEQAAVGMAELSVDGAFVRVNQTFSAITGYSADELRRRRLLDISHPEEVRANEAELTRIRGGEAPRPLRETRYLRKDGSTAHIITSVAPLRGQDGSVTSLVAVSQDVSDLHRVEEQLHQAQKLDAVGRLAGGIAHDFNNLLGGIIGYADLLRLAAPDNPEVLRDADAIISTGKRAADLTRNLLTLARRSPKQLATVKVQEVIANVVALLGRTLDRRIRIEVQPGGEPLYLQGDHAQLENAILNLAINARDAMPEGGQLTVTAAAVRLDAEFCAQHAHDGPPGEYVRVSVADNGMGMSPETMARIFEPFYTTKAAGQGTGLGLAMVYATVKNHHGLILVDSAPGKGTVFTAYLPRAAPPVAVAPADVAQPVPGSGRILFADDEEFLRQIGARMLTMLGYSVVTAENGRQAADRFAEEPDGFDLVVVDLNMPLLNGREVCRAIHAIRPEMKVILASGNASDPPGTGAAGGEFAAVIQKPFDLAELSQVIDSVRRGDAP